MAKASKIILLIIVLWFSIGTVDFLFNISGKLGHNYYIEKTSSRTMIFNKKIKQLLISDVLLWKFDDKHIILIRNKERFFDCKFGAPTYNDGLRYVVIDKITNSIMETKTYEKFQRKLRELNIDLSFLVEDVKSLQSKVADSEEQNKIKLKELIRKCKEDYIYPIKKY
jgi:hypothetical protein